MPSGIYQIESLFFVVGSVDGQVAHVDVGLFVFHDGNLGQILQHLDFPVRIEQVISCLIVYLKIGDVHLQANDVHVLCTYHVYCMVISCGEMFQTRFCSCDQRATQAWQTTTKSLPRVKSVKRGLWIQE